jgi:hypothetical protein
MTAAELTRHWQEHYGTEPVAYELRKTLPDRWVRIHGLPEMKRYPESPDEYAIILHRHNKVLSDLLGPGEPAIIVTAGYSDSQDTTPRQNPDLQHPLSWHWTSLPMEPEDPSSYYLHLFARVITWQPGILDDLLRLVASDKAADVMIIGCAQGVTYHPYDGGGDIIARDQSHRDELKVKFANWLSPLASGL